MVGADTFGLCPEEKLLSLVQDTIQRLHAQLHSERSRGIRGPGPAPARAAVHPLGHGDSVKVLKKLFWLFGEWSTLHAKRVRSLREELSTAACVLTERGAGAALLGASRENLLLQHAHIADAVLNVLEDVQSMENTLDSVKSRLDRAVSVLSGARPDCGEAAKETKAKCLTVRPAAALRGSLVLPLPPSQDLPTPWRSKPERPSSTVHSSRGPSVQQSSPTPTATRWASGEGRESQLCPDGTWDESTAVPQRGKDKREEGDVQDEEVRDMRNDTLGPFKEDGRAERTQEGEVEGGKKTEQPSMAVEREGVSWPTLGLPDSTSTSSSAPAVCYLTVPPHLTKLVTCKLVEGLSSLMVSGSEELVSSVLSVEIPSGAKCPFPLTIALPFRAYYRSSYREITVKAVDRERRVSYITPAATEGIYGGHRGSFAVVRVYSLGVFAVLSRLQKEMFTIPKRGLSLKLCVDPRICLDYQPGSFTTPAIAQVTVQPVDVMSTLKCRNDSYLSVLSTSPMLYLNHPSTLSPQRPLTLTLPCPPNPDKRTGEENTHLSSLSLTSNNLSPHRVSVLNASVKSSSDASKEQLEVLGCRGEQWNVLDKVSVRNLQNGLVSFELVENYERLIVLRLLSSTRPPCYMSSFVEELEESVRTCAVTIVLQTGREDPGSVALTALPSRELSCGLVELQAQDYWGRPEPSAEISMREGEQLLLRFSGNIISTGDQHTHTITFHSQRRNKLRLRLVELDPFGNHSSPHYRGTAVLFRVTRDQLVLSGDRAVVSDHYCLEEPVCKLSLTLPKTVRTVPRPLITKVLQHDRTEPLRDELLAWLSGELCEEDSALLARCLRLRRSAVQLARIRAPGSLARQTYHMLAAWRRALPSSTEKRPLLARCLGRIGRPELAEELLRRGPAVDEDEWRGVRERVAAEGSEGAHLGTRPSIT